MLEPFSSDADSSDSDSVLPLFPFPPPTPPITFRCSSASSSSSSLPGSTNDIQKTSNSSEVKNLRWELTYFTYMYHLENLKRSSPKGFKEGPGPLDMAKFEFDAGHSMGSPSKWEFCFDTSNIHLDMLGIDLRLKNSTEEENFASFEIELKRPNGDEFFRARSKVDIYRRYFVKGISNAVGSLKTLTSGHSGRTKGLTLHIRFEIFPRKMLSANFLSETVDSREREDMNAIFQLAIVEDLQQLLVSGRHSDVTIRTKDGKEFRVHKAILVSRSPVFLTMFESEMTETRDGVINLHDLGSEAFEIILMFIYGGGKLQDNWKDYIEDIVYAAEKYELAPLKRFFDKSLINLCTPQNAVNLLKLARKFNLQRGFKDISQYAQGNSDVFATLLESAIK